jgi:hypothetical protein
LLVRVEEETDAGLRAGDVQLHSQWLGSRLQVRGRNDTESYKTKQKEK